MNPIPVVILSVMAIVASMPPAVAECESHQTGSLLTIPFAGETPSSCPANDDLSAAAQALSDTSNGEISYIFVKDFAFYPSVATVRSGGTIMFVYLDLEWGQNHDPRSSGRCADSGVDPVADPEACAPLVGGRCFDAFRDMGTYMKSAGELYPLTFTVDSVTGELSKSTGVASASALGPLLGAEPFRTCPATSSFQAEGATILPYHCKIHGEPHAAISSMRGTIVIEA